MRDPQKVFGSALIEYQLKVRQLEDSLRFLTNMADDMHFSAVPRPELGLWFGEYDVEEAMHHLVAFIEADGFTRGPYEEDD